jgi:diguanylate cyclase (GGDEF)-like protein
MGVEIARTNADKYWMATGANGFSDPLADHGGWRWNLETREIEWSRATYLIHGVPPGDFEPTAESIRPLIHPDDVERYRDSVDTAIRTRAPFTVQHRIVRPDGAVRTLVVRGAFLPASNGHPDTLVGTTEDVTSRERSGDLLWHLANHDPLTGLLNRRRLMEELEREVAVAERRHQAAAVLMLDLDEFKEVNDLLGHVTGDTILTRVGDALRSRLRSTDALARLGGDEFAVVLPDCDESSSHRVAADLISAVASATKVQVAGRENSTTVSIGIAPFGNVGTRTAEGLLVEADLAMYRAKAQGGGMFEVFDEEMRAELAHRIEVEADLRSALKGEELVVHYQPIVSLIDGAPVGCEALVRWQPPNGKLLMPDDFIPIAEERGLIGEIGGFVLTKACEEAWSWRRAGRRLFVSVNVSPLQLLRDDVVHAVAKALDSTGLPPQLLCIEVTETSMIDNVNRIVPSLQGLKALGVRIAIDDFGGGSSSLRFLSALPIDVIKIDRVFIEGVADRLDDRAIVAAVLSLAEELELSVIAEGIETDRQQLYLRELGCRFAQGFLYAKPGPAETLQLDAYSQAVQPGIGDPSVVREFMRQIGIPAARVGS